MTTDKMLERTNVASNVISTHIKISRSDKFLNTLYIGPLLLRVPIVIAITKQMFTKLTVKCENDKPILAIMLVVKSIIGIPIVGVIFSSEYIVIMLVTIIRPIHVVL